MLQRLLSRAPFDSLELIMLAAIPCALFVGVSPWLGVAVVSTELQLNVVKIFFLAVLLYFAGYAHTDNPRGEEVFYHPGSSKHLPLWGALLLALLIEALFVLALIDLVLPRDTSTRLRTLLGLTRCGPEELCRSSLLLVGFLMGFCYRVIPTLGGVAWRFVLRASAKERRFRAVCYGLLAHIARADGRMQAEESRILMDFCREGLGLKASHAARVVDAIRERPIGSFRELLLRCVAQNPPFLREFILELLFALAAADGHVGPEEGALLYEAATRLAGTSDRIEELFVRYAKRFPPEGMGGRAEEGNSRHDSRRAKTQRTSADVVSPYTVLGVQPSDSLDTVKRRYRKLVKELHPDTLIAQGVPVEMLTQATRRFQLMQAAYEEIVREKGG